MLLPWIPVFFLVALALGTGASILVLTHLVGRGQRSREKLSVYECGITPVSDAGGRFPVKFYLVAVLSILFDVELVFLYPWAIRLKSLGTVGLVEGLLFVGILLLGYVYLWRKGALDW